MWISPQLKKKERKKRKVSTRALEAKKLFCSPDKMPPGTGKWQDMTMLTAAGFTVNELTIKSSNQVQINCVLLQKWSNTESFWTWSVGENAHSAEI